MKLDPKLLLALPVGVLLLSAVAAPLAEDALAPAAQSAPLEAAPPPGAAAPAEPAPRLGNASLDPALGRFVAPYGAGRAVLTLSSTLQERLTRTLSQNAVPWGVTVLIEPATGRVLAMAEHSRAEPGATGLALRALAPAASVFKLVTAAALLEQGVSPGEEVCFHGGKHRLDPRLLADDPRRDRRCTTLETAFGKSTNVVFAKLADRGLSADGLRDAASRFFFNTAIPFPRALEPSTAQIDDEPFQLANTAAGFGPVRLSPLHAALLASIVANQGMFVPPQLVERVEGAPAPALGEPIRVVDPEVAAALAEMMRGTVTEGTARKTFHRVNSAMRGVQVAGKTGSLSDKAPFRDYSWFVGFAPADHPEVAVATVIVNERSWRVRAPAVARDALEAYFETQVAEGHRGGQIRVARATVR
jgi:penicillin-binding protein A